MCKKEYGSNNKPDTLYNYVSDMVLPPNANVYYAVNTAFNLNFILRPKKNKEPEHITTSRPKPPKKSIIMP